MTLRRAFYLCVGWVSYGKIQMKWPCLIRHPPPIHCLTKIIQCCGSWAGKNYKRSTCERRARTVHKKHGKRLSACLMYALGSAFAYREFVILRSLHTWADLDETVYSFTKILISRKERASAYSVSVPIMPVSYSSFLTEDFFTFQATVNLL